MQVTIDVTQEKIASGVRKVCRECAVALAINERLAEGYASQVGSFSAGIIKDGERHNRTVLIFPTGVAAKISQIDAGAGLPFFFPLYIPDHLLRKEPSDQH